MAVYGACILAAGVVLWLGVVNAGVYTEEQLQKYLAGRYEEEATKICKAANVANWESEIDLENTAKAEALTRTTLETAKFDKDRWEQYFKDADFGNFSDAGLRRQVEILSELGVAVLDKKTLNELSEHGASMNRIYNTAKICPYKNQLCNLTSEGLPLDPDIGKVMAESRDYDELVYVWTAWRNASGAHMRDDYEIYVNISNRAAIENDYADMGDMWRSGFESDSFVEDIDELWDQVKPLYIQLHTYVRNKLKTKYGDKMDLGTDGLVPAHVFGDMWAQTWSNLYDVVQPYPNASPISIEEGLKEQEYTPLRMFQTADEFFGSLGLASNAMSYDEKKGSIISKLEGKEMVCHASAWDFCDGEDFRIKMCTQIKSEDFITIHHEMGHIQYYIQYKHQPITFRKGANPGFHEAIGDTIALSVSTPQHLEKIGLISNFTDSNEDSINALMYSALDKVAFMPFGLLIDKWRWDVFSGVVNESEWNSHWWTLREHYQLVKAPVERTENDFDPGSKYHVAADSEYISYFVARVLQFQFHRALCIAAGQFDPTDNSTTARPLHKCDIYQSKEAGTKLKLGLQAGGSQHWNKTLFLMTGSWKMDGSAMLEYYQPLQAFLEAENAKHDAIISVNTNITIIAVVVVLAIVLLVVGGVLVTKYKKKKTVYGIN